jgi:hypothetical protein
MEAYNLIVAGFIIMVIAVVGAAGFFVYCTFQFRQVTLAVTEFCRETDEKLTPVLIETEKTLRSLRVISDDVGAITGNVREVSDAVSDVAVNIRAIGWLIGDVREQVVLQAHGIKAGVQAALGMLIKNAGDRR